MTGDFEVRAVSVRRIAANASDILLELPDEAKGVSPEPGQFAHISAGSVFLRRPISIAGFDADKNRLRIVVRASGAGTAKIAGMAPGESARTLMPLGNPFPSVPAESGDIWLVGGGVGVAPLLFAAQRLPGARSFIGFADEASSFGVEELRARGKVSLSTGGLVTDLVARALETERPSAIFACGPAPMLEAMQKICGAQGIASFASLEERMGCGVGACLVCSCPAGKRGEKTGYRRVCRDGPVFDLSEVIFR
ncbi:MAG: dihydroorotate dehydrogenase electron transfer subunit [Synergistaceae bacterium]|jgi:dihydroorotate dehydrogenase electron transfer subunit|nr:dihydroorotate dehydrogenase electron transfer subunit [Synergistaceae bacterium]